MARPGRQGTLQFIHQQDEAEGNTHTLIVQYEGSEFVYAALISHDQLMPIRAAQRADELLAAGDIEGRAVWLRILAAVKESMETKPPGSVH